jgi:BirA family transcriptional regulator, biotin operon repressor / biotin---[acetyl-CoA-carboxylase] ligase
LPQQSARNSIGTPFIELQSVDSTNNYARSLLHEGMAEHGVTIFAHEQIAGKGQRGKAWYSEAGANIILSTVIKPLPLQLSQQFELSACISVAVYDLFEKYTGNDTKIKWPNDLYFKDRKAGGILIENIVRSGQSVSGGEMPVNSDWQWAIAGIGININQTHFPDELRNPVSLKQITGKDFDTVTMAKELCGCIEKYFRQLIAGNFGSIYSQYLIHLYKKNEKVKLKKGSRVFEAVIKSVSHSGKLIVQHAIEEEFDFGEVEWL